METSSSQSMSGSQLRPTLYLDVDGVLFHTGKRTYNLRPEAGEFIMWCNDHFECVWLTAWAEVMIKQLASLAYFTCASRWKCPKWKDKKTEGIDFNTDFVWVDDNASEEELEDIKLFHRKGRIQDVIHVDPNPVDHLPWIQEQLEEFLNRWRVNEGIYKPMDDRFKEEVDKALDGQ